MDFVCSVGFNFQLSKSMGCLSCMRKDPRAVLESSNSRMNVVVKSGVTNNGVDVIRVFNYSKQFSASLSHMKAPIFNSDVRGATIWT